MTSEEQARELVGELMTVAKEALSRGNFDKKPLESVILSALRTREAETWKEAEGVARVWGDLEMAHEFLERARVAKVTA